MKEQKNRDASTFESGKTDTQRGKSSLLSSNGKGANQQDNGNRVRTGAPVKNAKPEPPPVRVIIEGGRPDGSSR